MTIDPRWRPLRADEAPYAGRGAGPRAAGGEFCCPDFDAWAPYEIVLVELLGRMAKQGPHVLLVCGAMSDDPCECACGRRFRRTEAQFRRVT